MKIAPDFSLSDQTGHIHTLAGYVGKWLILYFYPKDDTPGCTVEACNFRDNTATLNEMGVSVLGISKDSISSHSKFQEKHKLNFPILSDESGVVCEAYGVLKEKSMFGKKYMGISRDTFIINPESEIAKEYRNVNPLIHVNQVKTDLETLMSVKASQK